MLLTTGYILDFHDADVILPENARVDIRNQVKSRNAHHVLNDFFLRCSSLHCDHIICVIFIELKSAPTISVLTVLEDTWVQREKNYETRVHNSRAMRLIYVVYNVRVIVCRLPPVVEYVNWAVCIQMEGIVKSETWNIFVCLMHFSLCACINMQIMNELVRKALNLFGILAIWSDL